MNTEPHTHLQTRWCKLFARFRTGPVHRVGSLRLGAICVQRSPHATCARGTPTLHITLTKVNDMRGGQSCHGIQERYGWCL